MGAERYAHDDLPKDGEEIAEARTVLLPGGMRWRASVVARLVSVDVAAGRESARLLLRLECLSARRRPARATIVGARSLADVSDQHLMELIARPSAPPDTAPKRGR